MIGVPICLAVGFGTDLWVVSEGQEEAALVALAQHHDGPLQHVGHGGDVDLLQVPAPHQPGNPFQLHNLARLKTRHGHGPVLPLPHLSSLRISPSDGRAFSSASSYAACDHRGLQHQHHQVSLCCRRGVWCAAAAHLAHWLSNAFISLAASSRLAARSFSLTPHTTLFAVHQLRPELAVSTQAVQDLTPSPKPCQRHPSVASRTAAAARP